MGMATVSGGYGHVGLSVPVVLSAIDTSVTVGPGQDLVILLRRTIPERMAGARQARKKGETDVSSIDKVGPENQAGVERPLSQNPSPPRSSGDNGAESNFLSVNGTVFWRSKWSITKQSKRRFTVR